MRTLLKVAPFLTGLVVLMLLSAFCWLYFYSRDLPDISRLAPYAPTTETQVSDPCLEAFSSASSSVAIPYDAMDTSLRDAIGAVETSESDPGILRTIIRGLLTEQVQRSTTVASLYLSRSMCYPRATSLARQLKEIRTAIQLERHYSRRQLFTMFANRSYFGPGLIGIESGAEFYFHKKPAELGLSEAALLAGLIRGPSWLSPLKHPDRALRRRNDVVDAMVGSGSIALVDAQAAKAAPLGVVAGTMPSP